MAIGLPSTRGTLMTGPSNLGKPGGPIRPAYSATTPVRSSTGIRATSMAVGAQPLGVHPATAVSQMQAGVGPRVTATGQMFPGMNLAMPQGQTLPGVNYTPQEMNISAQQNPQLAALQGDAAKLRAGLAAGSDQDAILALQRQRDLTSGMAKEFAGEAASRGILNTGAAQQDMLKRIVNPGQQQMGQLNAALASDARGKQLQALGQEAGMAGQQAGITQAAQNFGLQSWEARNQAQLAQAQLQQQQQNNQVNQSAQLMSLLGSFYSGF